MPIYEYHCEKCDQDIEVIQKFSDKPLKKHEDCGGKLEKKLSLAAFHLKGGGWYSDGYGEGGKPAAKAKEGTDKKASKADKPDKSAKPAAKETKKTKPKSKAS